MWYQSVDTYFVRYQMTITWISNIKDVHVCCKPRLHASVSLNWNISMLLNSVVVMNTHSQELLLVMITMRKSIHRFPFLSCMSMILLLGNSSGHYSSIKILYQEHCHAHYLDTAQCKYSVPGTLKFFCWLTKIHVQFWDCVYSDSTKSAFEMKTNCCLFERLYKINNGFFLFGISFFVLEMLIFLYYAN